MVRRRHSPTNTKSASGMMTYAVAAPCRRRARLRVSAKSTNLAADAAPTTSRANALPHTRDRVSSLDPVSTMVHASTAPSAESAVRAMVPPSSRTIMAKPSGEEASSLKGVEAAAARAAAPASTAHEAAGG